MIMDLTEIKNTTMIASSSIDGDICLWDSYTLANTSRLHAHLKGVIATAYSSSFSTNILYISTIYQYCRDSRKLRV